MSSMGFEANELSQQVSSWLSDTLEEEKQFPLYPVCEWLAENTFSLGYTSYVDKLV